MLKLLTRLSGQEAVLQCCRREAARCFITACTVVVLYNPMAKVMEKGDFRPPTAAKPLDRF